MRFFGAVGGFKLLFLHVLSIITSKASRSARCRERRLFPHGNENFYLHYEEYCKSQIYVVELFFPPPKHPEKNRQP